MKEKSLARVFGLARGGAGYEEFFGDVVTILSLKEEAIRTELVFAPAVECPRCKSKNVARERRPNGNDRCGDCGHVWPSSDVKDLAYWKSRGGQIEWRLEAARNEVREMERDLAECDEKIRQFSK